MLQGIYVLNIYKEIMITTHDTRYFWYFNTITLALIKPKYIRNI